MSNSISSAVSYTTTIYVGLASDRKLHNIQEARVLLQDYCNDVGLCVSITETCFVYTNGYEPGISVGLINYPRFPSTYEEIQKRAIDIAILLKDAFGQKRVSIVGPYQTIMIGDSDA